MYSLGDHYGITTIFKLRFDDKCSEIYRGLPKGRFNLDFGPFYNGLATFNLMIL